MGRRKCSGRKLQAAPRFPPRKGSPRIKRDTPSRSKVLPFTESRVELQAAHIKSKVPSNQQGSQQPGTSQIQLTNPCLFYFIVLYLLFCLFVCIDNFIVFLFHTLFHTWFIPCFVPCYIPCFIPVHQCLSNWKQLTRNLGLAPN